MAVGRWASRPCRVSAGLRRAPGSRDRPVADVAEGRVPRELRDGGAQYARSNGLRDPVRRCQPLGRAGVARARSAASVAGRRCRSVVSATPRAEQVLIERGERRPGSSGSRAARAGGSGSALTGVSLKYTNARGSPGSGASWARGDRSGHLTKPVSACWAPAKPIPADSRWNAVYDATYGIRERRQIAIDVVRQREKAAV